MSSRDTILARLRANKLPGEHVLPSLPSFPLDDGGDRVGLFIRQLERMGGKHHAGGPSDVASLFPDAAVIISAHEAASMSARDLADVDVAVVRAAFGIAETGSVLLTDTALGTNAMAYLAQHLVVLLDPADIVLTTQDAYHRPEMHAHHYAVFHTGPSATADIEGVLIHGAQGVRSLTVLFTARGD